MQRGTTEKSERILERNEKFFKDKLETKVRNVNDTNSIMDDLSSFVMFTKQ